MVTGGRAARDPTSNKLFQDSNITAILVRVPEIRYCLYVDGTKKGTFNMAFYEMFVCIVSRQTLKDRGTRLSKVGLFKI